MSDDASPRLGLPYVAAAQAQKHVTVNEAMMRLDGLVQTAVESRSVAAQPQAPYDGTIHILPAAASGATWTGRAAGTVMRFEAGGWAELAVAAGHIAWVKDEAAAVVFDGVDWLAFGGDGGTPSASAVLARSPGAATTGMEIREQEVAVAGASTTTSIVIPARSIVLGVSTRTSQAIVGASSYSCGIGVEAGKFGSSLGVTLGNSNIGIVGPTAFYSDTPVVLTAAGGAFTAGKVKVAIHLLTFAAPG